MLKRLMGASQTSTTTGSGMTTVALSPGTVKTATAALRLQGKQVRNFHRIGCEGAETAIQLRLRVE